MSQIEGLTIQSLTGPQARPLLGDLARLRTTVFRAFPYLYDGAFEEEQAYLATYFEDPEAVIVGCWDGERLVGAATGSMMVRQAPEWAAPFVARGDALETIFYCGESVLLAEYRGRGVGHAFFDHREAHARRLGAKLSCFCAVMRPEDHPLRPADYRPHDAFWTKRGYAPERGVIATFPWKDVDQPDETEHQLQFWSRRLS